MTSTKSILTKSKDWTSFKRTVDTLDNKTMGDAFEDLAQHFFQIDPKYRTKLKNVWNVNKREVPSRIHKKLNLPSPDQALICSQRPLRANSGPYSASIIRISRSR